MQFKSDELKKLLAEKEILTKKQFDELEKEAKKENIPLVDFLITKNVVKEELLAQLYSDKIGIPYIDLSKKTIRKDILFQIPELIAKKHEVVAFDEDEDHLKISLVDPEDLQTIEMIKKKIGRPLAIYLSTKSEIRDVLKQYRKGLQTEFNEIIEESLRSAKQGEGDLKKMAEDLPMIKIVETVLEHAVLENASDIHIEPLEKKLIIRYRVDGILHDVIVLPKELMTGIVARIKILANLKIDEHRLPQDGRFKIQKEGYKISFRVSIIPVFDGEKIVLRLLNESSQQLTLEQIGLQHSALETFKRNIKKPNGMILVTGPTGSGKTTTLYSVLHILNTPEVNISTIEDPIEYRMPRVNQSQVRPKIGFTFASGLRSLVRQDPDIIMVGEIRDLETAEIAIHSSLTGHLVLSTLHTNNAAGAAPRMLNMGVKPFLAASTINIIIGQRLVRKICTNCIEGYTLNEAEMASLAKNIDLEKILAALKKEKIIEPDKQFKDLTFYHGKGCEQCNGQGFKGRMGIFEVLEVTERINKLISQQATTEQIEAQAIEDGMITMLEDGFIKAKTGITTISEILRVTKS